MDYNNKDHKLYASFGSKTVTFDNIIHTLPGEEIYVNAFGDGVNPNIEGAIIADDVTLTTYSGNK